MQSAPRQQPSESIVPRTCVVAESIAAFRKQDWDRCFPSTIESWEYYRAVEEAGIGEFEWRYFAVLDGDTPIAVVPAFLTAYRLDSTVQGPIKRATDWLSRRLPNLLSIPLACLGSPVAEACHLGFAPDIDDAEKPALIGMLIAELARLADSRRIGLMGVKDARDVDAALWEKCLGGFQRTAGLPTAVLPMPFKTFDAYLASLSAATRKDMRRKLRAEPAIRIDDRTDISDVLDPIMTLYEETVARSDLQFERLPARYFTNVLHRLPENARCVLYWRDGDLLAFNLLLQSPDCLIDKFIGTSESARDYNVYFLSWMENVRRCIVGGIPLYQSGQAGYGVKIRLGSRLELNWNYFRHRNPALNALLRLVARVVRLDRFDPDIRRAIGGVERRM
jgi:hypothetical protein